MRLGIAFFRKEVDGDMTMFQAGDMKLLLGEP